VGFSLGGHAALRYATEAGDDRLRAVAAVCPPLDLAAGQRAIDRPGAYIYRRYVLGHLKDIYREVAATRPVLLPASEAEKIGTFWDWDEAIIAPRHGFEGAADYYARASVAPSLGGLRVPVLVVASDADPMVPASTLRHHLVPGLPRVEVRWPRRTGHVAFPRKLDLGYGRQLGLPGQLIAWLESHSR